MRNRRHVAGQPIEQLGSPGDELIGMSGLALQDNYYATPQLQDGAREDIGRSCHEDAGTEVAHPDSAAAVKCARGGAGGVPAGPETVYRVCYLTDRVLAHILIVQRQLSVLEEELEEFRLALRQYIESATSQTGCLHAFQICSFTINSIAVQKLSNESRFILYEFWEHSNVWKNHLQTNYSKTFQRSNVDFLETPEIMTTMLVPGKYTMF
ncbi:UNVERIFIED_CONTAM: hypothetical protein FKN15_029175 [Acipenser sinensis]